MKKPRDTKKLAARKLKILDKHKGKRPQNVIDEYEREAFEEFKKEYEIPKPRKAARLAKKQSTIIDKNNLRVLLDPVDGQYSLPLFDNLNMQDEFETLTEIAPEIFQKGHKSGFYPFVDHQLSFILADDITHYKHKLYAVICRAYWRYSDYCDAHNAKIAELKESEELVHSLDRSLDKLRDQSGYIWHKGKLGENPSPDNVLAQACRVLDNYYNNTKEVRDKNIQLADTIIRELYSFKNELANLTTTLSKGRPFQAPFIFFVMRLCEVWILLTGILPDPDYSPPVKDSLSRKTDPVFEKFILSALNITEIGVEGLDHALRIISGQENHMPEKSAPNLMMVNWCMNHLIALRKQKKYVEHANLATIGWLIDYHLIPEPTSYVTPKPDPDWKGCNQ